ncbi:Ribosome modulation factor [Pseudomonas coronafaciens pv. zizaniae]|uniref:Ribosome modulation factor n=2 Tax=Pseudomonas syringae group TaxID=136849 RepID=A0AB37QJB7_9PSED|nr:Ribosome modulation factor [Pseudomonas coronafaciens pv. garcae]KPY23292.1 Ribosome modulation factor [Pseudomonas coronafaciens pv. porri]RMO06120.1 Ribosome modulation factor [Pseudomonas coronafaciens pv. zizaniae]RMS88737.1 Ribosome modulation factor [Pseudomonas coronafaciens pv. oryzae]RMR95285.1 Ribosome modulation factor [Pseudomonas coronafaciens pv. garcae]
MIATVMASRPATPAAGTNGRRFCPTSSRGLRDITVNRRGHYPMRRLKRDPLERAFLRGYQYGVHGKSRELCPFTLPSVRQAWINGWREGRGDNWDGMTGTAGIHRLNELHAVG